MGIEGKRIYLILRVTVLVLTVKVFTIFLQFLSPPIQGTGLVLGLIKIKYYLFAKYLYTNSENGRHN